MMTSSRIGAAAHALVSLAMSTPFRTSNLFSNRLGQANPYQPPKSAVAAQFQAWVKEKEDLQKEAERTDRAREDLEKRLKDLRQQQIETTEKTHHAHSQLGGVHRQRELLLAEKASLQKTKAKERGELEECAKANEDARKVEREKKQEFCKGIAELNEELATLLREQEAARLKKHIAPETVDVIVAHHQKASDPSDSPESRKDDEALLQEMKAAGAVLREKTILHKKAVEAHQGQRAELVDVRSRVLNLGQTASSKLLTEGDLKALETKWLQNQDGGTSEEAGKPSSGNEAGFQKNPIHLQIFYDDPKDSSGAEKAESTIRNADDEN